MNYLAHVFLAENEPQSILGNLMADVLRRQDFDRLPVGIQIGIRQHRQIDSFTDRHPVVQRSIRRLKATWGWFGGIIIDVYYDHLLTENWDHFSEESLREFCDRINDILRDQLPNLPGEGKFLAQKLIENDRLYSYTSLDSISFALANISERVTERMPKHKVHLQDALPELQAAHKELSADFMEFFPTLISFSDSLKNRQRSAIAAP